MWAEINFLGHKGVSLFGIAAIDWACWDILGQSLGASVSRLLGRRRDRVPAYASGGLWASMPIAELEAQAKDFVGSGLKAVKMRSEIGRASCREREWQSVTISVVAGALKKNKKHRTRG